MPASDSGAGSLNAAMTEKDVRHETTLGAYSPVDYMSITSFPRLPEDDAVSAENNLRTRKDEDAFLSEQDTDPDLFLKSARLQRLPSSELGSQDVSPLRETHRDPLAGDCSCQHDGLTIIITACLTFATGVTVALIMQIYFGDPQIFIQGAVVTDVGRCSSLGVEVLKRQGSSVDAAIAAALCTGIINPHASGIGGMPWAEVLSLTAEVARGGFNVTHDLAEAVSKMKEQNVSDSFREIFMPEGQRVLPGSLMRRLDLADILDSVGTEGVAAFYSSNLTQEMVVESLKIALALASSLGDPIFDSTVLNAVQEMLNKSEAGILRQSISDSQAFPPGHYTPFYSQESGPSSSQVVVMGPDDFTVSVMSSLNRPFGSGILTSSGILLNSQMLDFSWQNKTESSMPPSPRNSIQPGKRPVSFLLPTVVRPTHGLCGTYLTLGGSSGERALSSIAQVLLNVLSFHKNLSDSLSLGRLHPQLEPSVIQVDNEFLEEDIGFLEAKGHDVKRVDVLSLVEGTRRTNDLIIGVKDPRSEDATVATTS
ncbi:Gamma-glutamyltransferase 7 [Acipenser ruthenus]|uniref:Gamma-glutamyltransferase 7 n=1 Tax=Acipenser ruthenus TaxID=7906 RepID=A0A444UWL8_ACIRT|nr:Gamma-glutamyltransferase 7 [Acipenser ruthenus]